MSPIARIVTAALAAEERDGLEAVAAYHRAVELHPGHSPATYASARRILAAARRAAARGPSENMRRQLALCEGSET